MFTLNDQVTINYPDIHTAMAAAALLVFELRRSVRIYQNGKLLRLLRF